METQARTVVALLCIGVFELQPEEQRDSDWEGGGPGAGQAHGEKLQSAESPLCWTLSWKLASPSMLRGAFRGGRTGKHFFLKAARDVAVGLVCPWALVAIPTVNSTPSL